MKTDKPIQELRETERPIREKEGEVVQEAPEVFQKTVETQIEQQPEYIEEKSEAKGPVSITSPEKIEAATKSQLYGTIETILAEGAVGEIYFSETNALPEDVRMNIKNRGESMTQEIESMVLSGKFDENVVQDKVANWLKEFPRLSQTFITAESYNRTMRIKKLVEGGSYIKE